MASRFECPRCGCGIKPSDTQCDRCGEPLRRPASKSIPSINDQSFVVEKVIHEEKAQVCVGSEEKLRQRLDEKEKELVKRERALVQKETEAQELADSLAHDSADLEEAMAKFEDDKRRFQEKEEELEERQVLIHSVSKRTEDAFKEVSSIMERSKAGQLTPEEEVKLHALRQKFVSSLEPERRNLSKKPSPLDVDKMLLLEAKLKHTEKELERLERQTSCNKATEDHASSTVTTAPLSEDTVREIHHELDQQIGKEGDLRECRIIPTHIDRLDRILGGGIPCNHLVLFSGAPGTMKTTLTFSILYNVVKKENMTCLYLSLEQSREAIARQMAQLGMEMKGMEDRLLLIDMVGLRKSTKDEPGDWRSILLRYVTNLNREKHLDMLVLDSLESFKSICSYDFTRQDLKDLFEWFKTLGITVFVIAEKGILSVNGESCPETYLADGVVEIITKELDEAKIQRWLRVVKMRGMNVDQRYYSLFHENKKFVFTLPIVELEKLVP